MSGPDLASFAELYERHVSPVYGFFGYRVGSREQAGASSQRSCQRSLIWAADPAGCRSYLSFGEIGMAPS